MRQEVQGRGQWVSSLTSALPLVTLLRAPASTGKRTVAEHVARSHGVAVVDQMFFPLLEYRDEYGREVDFDKDGAIPFEPELSVDHVRELRRWSRIAPLSSPFKVAIVRLDHVRSDGSSWSASPRVLASMLKLLEEPPTTARFILLATRPTASMIKSRCVEFQAGLLPVDTVSDILFRVSDLSEKESQLAASLGGGRVASSLAMRSGVSSSRQAVIDVLTSLAAGDSVALTEKSRIWTEMDTEMLRRWAHERISGRWSVFSVQEASQLSSSAAERVLRVVGASVGARPRVVLGAVSALAVT